MELLIPLLILLIVTRSFGEVALPEALDSSLIAFDWTSGWLRVIKLDADGKIVFNEPWLGKHRFIHPGDMAFDKRGQLYVLEDGTPWYDGKDGKLKRITSSETPIPIMATGTDPRIKGLPPTHPGTKLVGSSTCLGCHPTTGKSIGPAYADVAKRYRRNPAARDTPATRPRRKSSKAASGPGAKSRWRPTRSITSRKLSRWSTPSCH